MRVFQKCGPSSGTGRNAPTSALETTLKCALGQAEVEEGVLDLPRVRRRRQDVGRRPELPGAERAAGGHEHGRRGQPPPPDGRRGSAQLERVDGRQDEGHDQAVEGRVREQRQQQRVPHGLAKTLGVGRGDGEEREDAQGVVPHEEVVLVRHDSSRRRRGPSGGAPGARCAETGKRPSGRSADAPARRRRTAGPPARGAAARDATGRGGPRTRRFAARQARSGQSRAMSQACASSRQGSWWSSPKNRQARRRPARSPHSQVTRDGGSCGGAGIRATAPRGSLPRR